MVNSILTVGSVIGVLLTIGGLLLALYKIMRRFEKVEGVYTEIKSSKIIGRLENLEESATYRKEESALLIRSQLAIMEGLIQLKCNGPVTHCRDELQEYICKRGD